MFPPLFSRFVCLTPILCHRQLQDIKYHCALEASNASALAAGGRDELRQQTSLLLLPQATASVTAAAATCLVSLLLSSADQDTFRALGGLSILKREPFLCGPEVLKLLIAASKDNKVSLLALSQGPEMAAMHTLLMQGTPETRHALLLLLHQLASDEAAGQVQPFGFLL